MRKKRIAQTLTAAVASAAVAALCAGVTTAYADPAAAWFSKDSNVPTAATTVDTSKILTTYGVRAGSAGPDFLGVANTNFDFQPSHSTTTEQGQWDYTTLSTNSNETAYLAGLAIWGGSVNEDPNPFYANLLYNYYTGNAAGTASENAATTWHINPGTSAWGDTDNQKNANGATAGEDFGTPDIVYGANKYTNWGNLSYESTNWYKNQGDKVTYTNNDSTNIWTQVYSMGQLGVTADKLAASTSQTVRYGSATDSAINYEKGIRGNLLYIASQIDQGKQKKKTVAYLYAIDGAGTAWFFAPQASKMTKGADTGKESVSSTANASGGGTFDPDYAANNGTIDLGYMGVLPYITNTFADGTEATLNLTVEDIQKACPAVSVTKDKAAALKDVDVILFNTNKGLTNYKGSEITGSSMLTASAVQSWLTENSSGFSGTIIAGEDYATSNGALTSRATATEGGQAPLLYCLRNYTADKNSRAAWAFSQVYPELYGNNADASYGYWVKNIYHVKMANVPAVVKYMEANSSDVTYTDAVNTQMEKYFLEGYNWWKNTGSSKADWKQYAYYTGSSRASFYDGDSKSEEPADTIGIFQPTLWSVEDAAATTPTTKKAAKTITINVATVTAKSVKAAAKKAGATVASLKSVTLGKKVKKIGAQAFKAYKNVKTVTIKSTKLKKAGVKNCFKGSKVKTVKVPKAKKKAYKKIFTKKICGAKVTVK